jgi:amino acid transporter
MTQPQLARKLRLTDYFTFSFGSMIGVGWLVLMDDWLGRGGPLGAILGFVIGGAVLYPVGYVYGRLVMAYPDAAGEVAYTSKVFPPWASYATGWMMLLAYAIVCPWEAVAIGRVASYILPALNSIELYRVSGQPVFLPHVVLGFALTVLIAALNYRGIKFSAMFQNVTTFGLLLLFGVFGAAGMANGSAQNFAPLFSGAPLLSILLVLQIVPYFMTGFEAVSKAAEEAHPDFPVRDYMRAPLLAITVGIFFYAGVVAVVSWAQPWQTIAHEKFSTAVALERAVGSRWVVNVILAAALLSLMKCFNGNYVAASRLLFAMARREIVPKGFARVHPAYHTPAASVSAIGLGTATAMLLGPALLVGITEVGSLAAGFGWMMACAAYAAMKPSPRERAVAIIGAVIGASLVLMKVAPFVPGHFTANEYIVLGLWIVLGLLFHRRPVVSAGPNP